MNKKVVQADLKKEIIFNLIDKRVSNLNEFQKVVRSVYGKLGVSGNLRTIEIRDAYEEMVKNGEISSNQVLEKVLVTKKMRSLSGVSVITVLTKPYPCPGKCIYCPTRENVPKSYLADEPAVMRAILNEYDPVKQVKTRLTSLKKQGHPIDKIELIVIGGTFNFLPKEYQEEFVKNCFDALNGFVAKDLTEAKLANEKAKSKCVGLTLETRPDFITETEVAWFRFLGATRVEMGVQSIFDDVLEKNARGHKVAQTIEATKLLKDAGFKITYHLMPNLFGSDLEKDKQMFRMVFEDADFKPDYIKIYPCMVMAETPLEKLLEEGKYRSYSDNELIGLICDIKKHVPYSVRIMRTVRDIPAANIISGSKTSNLRQIVTKKVDCHCIRCREIRDLSLRGAESDAAISIFVEEYSASEGKEFFLSYETAERKHLYALLRLRLPSSCHSDRVKRAEGSLDYARDDRLWESLPELKNAALIREVHTYGQEAEVGDRSETQHRGFGKRLIAEAERIAKENGFNKIAVISGVGVRSYYRKFGYELNGEYMTKNL